MFADQKLTQNINIDSIGFAFAGNFTSKRFLEPLPFRESTQTAVSFGGLQKLLPENRKKNAFMVNDLFSYGFGCIKHTPAACEHVHTLRVMRVDATCIHTFIAHSVPHFVV